MNTYNNRILSKETIKKKLNNKIIGEAEQIL